MADRYDGDGDGVDMGMDGYGPVGDMENIWLLLIFVCCAHHVYNIYLLRDSDC